jgi:hypothetical protein
MQNIENTKCTEDNMDFKSFIGEVAEYAFDKTYCEFESYVERIKIFKNEEYRRHKTEMLGIFTLNEAVAIISLFQSYPSMTPLNNNKDVLIWEVEDGITYDFLVERFDINKDRILEKLKKLTEEQSATVIVMAIEFWISTYETTCNENDVIKEIFMVN